MKKLALSFALVCAFLSAIGAPAQVTPNVGLNLPPQGTTNWNVPINQNFTLIDQLLSGVTALPPAFWTKTPPQITSIDLSSQTLEVAGQAQVQSLAVQNTITSNTQTANNIHLTGDPVTCPAGDVCYGGNYYPCPSGAPAGASTCVKVNFNGTDGYVPIFTGTSSGGNPSWWPSIPATATTFANLQQNPGNPGVWILCNANGQYNTSTNTFTSSTPCNAGTVNGVGSATVTFGVSSPSQSGGSFRFDNTTSSGSSTGFNTLAYRHLGASWAQNSGGGTNTNTSITNMVEDLWFYPSPGANSIGFEFDPDIGVSGTTSYTYKASIACYSTGAGDWRLYDTSGSGWQPTGLACPYATWGGSWHHVQLWVTYNQTSQNYTYQGLAIDGTSVFTPTSHAGVTVTYNAGSCSGTTCGSLGNNVNIEMQVDNNSSTGTSTGYYDKYTLTVW